MNSHALMLILIDYAVNLNSLAVLHQLVLSYVLTSHMFSMSPTHLIGIEPLALVPHGGPRPLR